VDVLIVEDEVVVGFALREELQELGVDVSGHLDAESALEQLALRTFDVAIIDITLPGMSGDVFAKECRRRFPRLPIVMTTGLNAQEVRAVFAGDGCLEVIEKPHDFAALRACLERLGIVFDGQAVQLADN
jgi:DNA-binding response OmpR family regulator